MAVVISYGGGVQSTALIVLAVLEGWDIDEIVHVDLLGAESPATREARNDVGEGYRFLLINTRFAACY